MAAAEAAEGVENVAVDEAEGHGHGAADVCDGEEGEWDAEDGVQHRDDHATARLRRDVSVTCRPTIAVISIYGESIQNMG